MLGNRRSIRLRGYDYTRPAAYFLTLCVKNRECLFGEIAAGKMQLNEFGRIVSKMWRWMETQYPYVDLDAYVVMPDHFHGILWIVDGPRRGDSPLRLSTQTIQTMKQKRWVWQRNYYERIIRNDTELIRIQGYIDANPARWLYDVNNSKIG